MTLKDYKKVAEELGLWNFYRLTSKDVFYIEHGLKKLGYKITKQKPLRKKSSLTLKK